jgi:hypothetical protein
LKTKLRKLKARNDRHYFGPWTIRWPLTWPIAPAVDPVAKHKLLLTSELGSLYGATTYPTENDRNLQAAKDAVLGITPEDRKLRTS